MIDVTGKWALITGSSRGIGQQIARFMAKQGVNLILHSSKADHTKEIEAEVKSYGVEAYSVEANLAVPSEIDQMLNTIEKNGTPVEIVFNNAGVQIAYREDYWQTPREDFEASFQTNFLAPVAICYHLIPKMVERGFGRVVNVTSGIKDQPEQMAYATSKAALDKFTKDLGSKLEGTNVVVSLADPGWIRTDMGGEQAPNPVESVIPGIAVGAFVESTECGRFFAAQDFALLDLEQAVTKAEAIKPHGYTI